MRIIPFTGYISRDKVELLLNSLRANYSSGCVVVDSPGGEYELFSRLGPPLARTGFVSVGKQVASAAILLHLLGRKRFALPDATFFFHEVGAVTESHDRIELGVFEHALDVEREMEERWSEPVREFVEDWRSDLASTQSWMFSFISNQTGLSSWRYLDLARRNITLTAREAVQYGLVHRIISLDEFAALERV